MVGLVTVLVLSGLDPYVRTRTSEEPAAHCLWWGERDIRFQQSVVGNPATGMRSFNAVSTAFATWQVAMAQCGSATISEGPRIASRKTGVETSGANVNLVLFRTTACSKRVPANHACWADHTCSNAFDCWDHSNSLLGVTVVSYDTETGKVFDADVELNAASNVFTAVDAPVCSGPATQSCVAVDIQNTVTHEVGHFLGLDHTQFPQSTMASNASSGEVTKRILDVGSKSFVCDAYPRGLGALDCVVEPIPSQLGNVPMQGCSMSLTAPVVGLALLLRAARRRRRGLVELRKKNPFSPSGVEGRSPVPTLFLLLTLSSTVASASTVLALDWSALRSAADVVVRAKVQSSTARWSGDHSRIVTEVKVEVVEVLKGEAASTIVVAQPGGIVGKVGQRVSGVVPLVEGAEVVLFLEAAGPMFRIVGLSQGLFVVERDLAGVFVRQVPIEARAVDESGVELPALVGRVSLPTLRRVLGRAP